MEKLKETSKETNLELIGLREFLSSQDWSITRSETYRNMGADLSSVPVAMKKVYQALLEKGFEETFEINYQGARFPVIRIKTDWEMELNLDNNQSKKKFHVNELIITNRSVQLCTSIDI